MVNKMRVKYTKCLLYDTFTNLHSFSILQVDHK